LRSTSRCCSSSPCGHCPPRGCSISSLRDKNLIATSGWWTALTTTVRSAQTRTAEAASQVEQDGKFVISGNLFEGAEDGPGTITAFGTRVAKPDEFAVGATASYDDGRTLTVKADGTYSYTSPVKFEDGRGQRVFYMTAVPPNFTTENYSNVLFSQGIGRAFVNSLTVTIPATVIPILIAAFAAYALAWMKIPGRGFMIAVVVGLLVVPLQMWRVHRLRRPLGLRQVHAAAHDRRAGGHHQRRDRIDGQWSTRCRRRSAASPWCSSPTRSTRT
jgi:alpha-glucoside transport system permease protein